MLKWLGGGATAEDDPMADLVKVKEMLATIPPEDSVRAVQDAVAWLESVPPVMTAKAGSRPSNLRQAWTAAAPNKP